MTNSNIKEHDMKKSILFCFVAALLLQMFPACKKEPQMSLNTQNAEAEATYAQETEAPVQFDQSFENSFYDMEEDDFLAAMNIGFGSSGDGPDKIDIDLTKCSYTMASAIIFDMLLSQNDYLGKRIKIKGQFWANEDDSNQFFAVLMYDATACCQTGLTFKDKNRRYPEDYPAQLEEIEITGVYTKEEIDGMSYAYIDCSK